MNFGKYHIASLVIIVVVALLGASLMYMRKSTQSQKTEKFTADANGSAKNTLVWYMADWCPHCQSMKGEWATVEAELKGSIPLKTVKDTDEEIKTKNVDGFPTIRMERPDGTYVTFSGPRKAAEIIAFAKKNSA